MEDMKVIDAHAHVGEFGGWANVRITAEEMIADMDTFNISKTVVCMIPNGIVREAVQRYPDQLIGFVWVNPHVGPSSPAMGSFCLLWNWRESSRFLFFFTQDTRPFPCRGKSGRWQKSFPTFPLLWDIWGTAMDATSRGRS